MYGYDCGVVLIEAFKKAGKKDRDAIRKAVFEVTKFEGATGSFRFDPATGDTTNQFMTVNRVQKVQEVDPDTKVSKTVSQFVLTARLELPKE